MEPFKLENLQEAGSEWQKIIEPETPEQPLIRVLKKKEMTSFEAAFALELAGVTRKKEGDQQPSDKSEANNTGNVDKNHNFLLSGISSGQRVDFIYSSNKERILQFRLKIVGYSKGETSEESVNKALSLWQNLSVMLGTLNDYCFVPVTETDKLTDEDISAKWIGVVRPLGIAVNADSHLPVGFRQNILDQKISGVVVVPFDDSKKNHTFDVVVNGSAGCPGEVKVRISIIPFGLSGAEIKKIALAVKWLREGEKKQINYYHDIGEGVEDEKAVTGLQNALNLWLKNPYGFHIICTVVSDKPIPSSFLTLIGHEIFSNSPISISMEKITSVKNDLISYKGKDSDQNILNLQSCMNSANSLPSLLPGVKTLIESGTKILFKQVGLNISNEGILIGRVNIGATTKDIRFPKSDRSKHCYIVGATGTGKSTLLYNMIKQDIENGEGVGVLDPHGDLYQQVLESIPEHRIDDVILINPCDFENAVGINFLECNGPFKSVQLNFISNEMIKIFDRLYDLRVTGGPIFETYLRNTLLLCMDNDIGATLMDVPMVFEDREYRQFLKSKCKSRIVVDFFTKQAEEAGGEASLKNLAPYITSKLNQFTTNALLRPIIGQRKSTIDFREVMDERKIILVNLAKGLLGELDTQLLGMLLIGKIFSSSMGRIVLRPEERHPFFLYVDEAATFLTDTVAHLLSEARKFGIFLTLANQNLSQLSSGSGRYNILDSVLGNVGTILIFRIGAIDSHKMEIYTKPVLLAQDLQELPDFHAVGRLLLRNSPSKPFVFETILPEKESNRVDVEAAICASRAKYNRPVEQVENEILMWKNNYRKLALVKQAIENIFNNGDETEIFPKPFTR